MQEPYNIIIAIIGAYCIGCVNFGYYLVRILRRGEDIREHGSGNAGATNAGRVMGKRGFALVAFLDGVKGIAAILLAHYLEVDALVLGLCLFFCVLGHVYPLQLGFRGGRGVASACGGICAINPLMFGVLVAVFAVLYLISKKYHLSGIACIICLPLAAILLGQPCPLFVGYILLILLMLWQFRGRISEALFNKSV